MILFWVKSSNVKVSDFIAVRLWLMTQERCDRKFKFGKQVVHSKCNLRYHFKTTKSKVGHEMSTSCVLQMHYRVANGEHTRSSNSTQQRWALEVEYPRREIQTSERNLEITGRESTYRVIRVSHRHGFQNDLSINQINQFIRHNQVHKYNNYDNI